jgi:hypothetical protein
MRARYVPACQVPLLRPDRNLARDRDGNCRGGTETKDAQRDLAMV